MTPPANDARPKLGCGSFRPGHQVHWIQALRVAKRICGVRARWDGFDPDGGTWVELTFPDGHTERHWNHDGREVVNLLGGDGRGCTWKTTGLLIVGGAGGAALCLSSEANHLPHCPPPEPLPPFRPRIPTVHHLECRCPTCATRSTGPGTDRPW